MTLSPFIVNCKIWVKGTRVTIKTLFDYLEEESLEEFLKGFPSVTREQAEGVIEIASEKLISELSA